MAACLEKTEENVEFHQIVDFLSTCSINYALTVSLTIYASYIEQFWNTATSKTVNSVKQIHAIVDVKAVVISKSSVRSDLLFNDEDGIACLTNDEIFENLALIRYEQLSTKLTFQKGDSPRHQETRGGAPAQTRSERVLKEPNEPSLPKGHTSGSGEGSMEHTFELMDNGRTSDKIKPMFKDSDFDDLDDLVDEGITFVQEKDAANQEAVNTASEGVSTADQVSTARPKVSVASVPVNVSAATPSTPPTTTTIFGDEDLTIAQTLVKMRSEKAKEKEKGVVLRDEEESPRLNRSTTTLQPFPTIDPKDKELAQRLHEEELAELDIAQKERQKQEDATSAALDEEFDESQARIDVDHELTVRLTHKEQEKYTIEERARLLAEFFKRRKKQLAAKRAEAIRNKLPTRTQVRNMMITYLKHMGKYTHQQLKYKNSEEVQKLYKREKKWIDDFKPIDDDIQHQAESTKRDQEQFLKKKVPRNIN
ncbi:hypothetical protein Tco_0474014 [Tanacetum coccineum]